MINVHDEVKVVLSLQRLVKKERFNVRPTVSREMVKEIVNRLVPSDYMDYHLNQNGEKEMIIIYISDQNDEYYIKFKFDLDESTVLFLSFFDLNKLTI